MKYVYILQSISEPDRHYTGLSDDVELRLAKHNNGDVKHTSKFRPWRLETYMAFTDQTKAVAFEQYLKSGLGCAFAAKRLWLNVIFPKINPLHHPCIFVSWERPDCRDGAVGAFIP